MVFRPVEVIQGIVCLCIGKNVNTDFFVIQEEAHLNIPIYPEITSGVQPHRHLVTYHLRENLEKNLMN